MTNWRNRVFTNLKTIIDDSDVTYCLTNDYEIVSDKTIYFQLISNIEQFSDLDSEEENGQVLLFQIETYTKSLEDGYSLMGEVVDAMKSMFFRKVTGIELMANTNTNYKRLVARFSRVVGSGDEIIKV